MNTKKRISLFMVIFTAVLFFAGLITSCSKAYADKANGDGTGGTDSSSLSGNFSVLSVSPEGEIPPEISFPSIQIQFADPVVPLEKLGEASAECSYAKIEPPLAGEWRWFGTSLLSFECKDRLIPMMEYTIKVNPETVNIGNQKISGKLEYKFYTGDFEITSIVPGYDQVSQGRYVNSNDIDVEIAKKVRVYFNSDFDESHLAKQLEVYYNDASNVKRNLRFDVVKKEYTSLIIEIKDQLPLNTDIYISLPQGTSAKEGYRTTSKVSTQDFHTLRPFEYKYCDDSPYLSEYANPVVFNFSHNLTPGSEAEVAKLIKTEPYMLLTKDNVVIKNRKLIVHGLSVSYDSTYSITIDGKLKDFYGRELENSITESITVQPAASFVHFKDYGFHILEAQFAPKLAFEYQNITGGDYSLRKLERGVDFGRNEPVVTNINTDELPKDTRCLQAVDLTPVLNKTPEGYRGSLRFKSGIKYMRTKWDKTRVQDVNDTYMDIMVTDLAVSTRFSYDKAVVLVTSMSTGKPVKNAVVNFVYSDDYNMGTTAVVLNPKNIMGSAVTDEKGFAEIEFDRNYTSESYIYVEAYTENDRVVCLASNTNMYRSGARHIGNLSYPLRSRARTFIFTDRKLYKPGETVTFRGIDRSLLNGEYNPYIGGFTLQLTDGSWRPKVYAETKGTTTTNGTFWNKFVLPEDLEPGYYEIKYTRDSGGQYAVCPISVQFFERLRFEAKTEIPQIQYVTGDDINATISAQYLGGGSMNDCSYSAYWTREPSGFAGAGKYQKYRFGPSYGYDGRSSLTSEEGRLNAEGKVNLSITTGGEKVLGCPYIYRVETTVMDSGNQAIATVGSVLVHSSKFYLGLSASKRASGFSKKGEKIAFDYVLVTPDSEVPDESLLPAKDKRKLNIEVQREVWKEVQQVSWDGEINTRYERDFVTEYSAEQDLVVSENPTEISFVPKNGGYYTIRLSTEDCKGNEIITERSFYVFSSDFYWWNRNSAKEITLMADKDSYSVGDTAHVLLQSPLPAGTYMITVERENIISNKVITLNEPTTVIDVDIDESFVPVVYVAVTSYSVRNGDPKNDFYHADLDKPCAYFGAATLFVDLTTKRINIDVNPTQTTYKPGEYATINLHVTDGKGNALPNAEITLMAVDRGVIDLINYHVPNPLTYFYDEYWFKNCVKGGDSRYYLMDPVTYEIKNLIGGDSEGDDKLNERKNFDPTAVFLPALITDADGNVTATFKLPDTLTAYRITAVGVKENTFGITENEINVANPVSVRQVLPRKLRLDDEGEMGVVISNLEKVAHDVNVTLNVYEGIERTGIVQGEGEVKKLPGRIEVTGEKNKTIKVSGETTKPLMFTAKGVKPGWVTLEFIVKSDVVNEKILLPFEIEKPYIYETVVTVGQISQNKDETEAKEQIVIPSACDDGKGELTLTLDTTRLGTLGESVNYLFHYPYGCMEQRSSAILPLAIFGEYIDVFGLNSEVENPRAVVEAEIATWGSAQKNDGGIGYWKNSWYSSPYVSARVGEILAICKEKGIKVNSINTSSLAHYLKKQAVESLSFNKKYIEEKRPAYYYGAAYEFYVASLLGEEVSDTYLEEIASYQDVELDTLAFVALTYINKNNKSKAKQIADKIRKYTTAETRGLKIQARSKEGWNAGSFFTRGDSEVYALCLSLYTQLKPEDEINQRLLYEILIKQRATNGYWQSTAVTSRVLNSIYLYIKSNNLEGTDLTAEMLLDGVKVNEGSFKGLGAKAVEKSLDFTKEAASFKRDTPLNLNIKKEGTGSLFYTVKMKYALPVEDQKAKDYGLCIFTRVVDVKTGLEVKNNQLEEGKVYKMEVFVSSTRDRNYVAVRVPVPAGCEIVNAAFVTNGGSSSSSVSRNGGYYYDDYDGYDYYDDDYYYYCNISNEEIYDTEVHYFYDWFYRGGYSSSFLFRATRKGTYNVPSATTECMYQEEVFGRTSGSVWTIK